MNVGITLIKLEEIAAECAGVAEELLADRPSPETIELAEAITRVGTGAQGAAASARRAIALTGNRSGNL